MKPEGNRVGNCIGWNAKPQRPIGYQEEAKAESGGVVLQESAAGKRNREWIEPVSGTNL
jgi:hypothetical protein